MSDKKVIFLASTDKHDRAKQVINYPNSFGDNSVERTLLDSGLAEKLEDQALVEHIYRGLGGLVLTGEKAKEVKKAVEDRKTHQRKRGKK